MAITSVDDIIAGSQPPVFFYRSASGTLVAGRPFSPAYVAGIPGPLAAPASGINGAILTSKAGQLRFVNPTAGKSCYLGRFAAAAAQAGVVVLYDRIWENSGLSVTSTASQAISMPTLPARDIAGTSDGVGVLIGMEVVTTTGVGSNAPTLTYTNSDGITGRTASLLVGYSASSPAGTFYPFALAAGDVGVRAVTAFQNSVSMTSGAISLVAYRVIAHVDTGTQQGDWIDPLSSGMPQMFNDTVPFIYFNPSTTTSSQIWGTMTLVHA